MSDLAHPGTDTPRPRVGTHRMARIRAFALLAVMAAAVPAAFAAQGGRAPEELGVTLRSELAPDAGLMDAPLSPQAQARVEGWMGRILEADRELFEDLLSRKTVLEPLIRQKLRERGLPQDLIYLAMVESGFSPRAISPKGALGLWQFMAPTAVQYGLRVDEWVDERRDPVRATDAALDYLEWLHGRFGSWTLAIAAYNAGPGLVERTLAAHGADPAQVDDALWKAMERLPRETREHFPKIVAASILARQTRAFGFEVERQHAYSYDRVWVPGGTSIFRLADSLDLDAAMLRQLNPHLLRGVTPPETLYGLRVPVGSVPQVMAALGGALPGTASQD